MTSVRQESELMDQLREVEELEAKDRLNAILEFCKAVSTTDDVAPPAGSLEHFPNLILIATLYEVTNAPI